MTTTMMTPILRTLTFVKKNEKIFDISFCLYFCNKLLSMFRDIFDGKDIKFSIYLSFKNISLHDKKNREWHC